jgi:hypothetical protein
MARIIRKETRKRGFFGWLFLLLFLAFNTVMVAWLISYWNTVGRMTTHGDAEAAGAAIGATIGTSMLLGIWMAGAVILGIFVLLSRGRKTLIEETTVE